MKYFTLLFSLFISIFFCFDTALAQDKNQDKTLRQYVREFDGQFNTKGNTNYCISNNGMSFFNSNFNRNKCVWPRDSKNAYITGAGLWLGALKRNTQKKKFDTLIEYSYNPAYGISMMRPGVYYPGMSFDSSSTETEIQKNKVYVSTDYDRYTGKPINDSVINNWPVWITDNKNYYFNSYVNHYEAALEKRNHQNYPYGPMFVSDEDIVTTFHDYDFSLYKKRYQYDSTYYKKNQYPIGLQIKQTVYNWERDSLKDQIVINYEVTNISGDTLFNCYFGGIVDPDIFVGPDITKNVKNDFVRYFKEDSLLNLAVAWSDTSAGDGGHGLGYLGVSLLESPAVDKSNFIRKDKLIFDPSEQIGLNTFNSWALGDTPLLEGPSCYVDMSKRKIFTVLIRTDHRIMLSCGPFSMLPGDKANVSFCINFAAPAKGGEADGTLEDIAGLTNKSLIEQDKKSSLIDGLKLVRDVYYNKIKLLNVASQSEKFSKMRIYPNPASSILSIDGIEDKMLEREYRIISINGVLISKGKFAGNIDISSLAPGAYYILIDGVPLRFIKQ